MTEAEALAQLPSSEIEENQLTSLAKNSNQLLPLMHKTTVYFRNSTQTASDLPTKKAIQTISLKLATPD